MQNYPLYEVVTGNTLPALGPVTQVFVVQQGVLISQGNTQWTPAPPDPNNNAVTQGNPQIPGNVYVVGTGSNGTYANAAAAQAAANAYCQSLATTRDQNATKAQYAGGDATRALSNPTVELGPL